MNNTVSTMRPLVWQFHFSLTQEDAMPLTRTIDNDWSVFHIPDSKNKDCDFFTVLCAINRQTGD